MPNKDCVGGVHTCLQPHFTTVLTQVLKIQYGSTHPVDMDILNFEQREKAKTQLFVTNWDAQLKLTPTAGPVTSIWMQAAVLEA